MTITPIFAGSIEPASGARQAIRLTSLSLACGLLAACAQQPTIYSWDSYQPAVYDYLQGEKDPAAQALSMEKNIEVARAKNKALPPGFHAHLGLLYLQQGEDARALEQIQSESAAFPESVPFMNFLLKKKTDTDKAISVTVPGDKQVPAAAPATPHSPELVTTESTS